VTISQAIDLYLSEIILSELAGKSPEQIATFSKIKHRAVARLHHEPQIPPKNSRRISQRNAE
jgi:hypothetical protein